MTSHSEALALVTRLTECRLNIHSRRRLSEAIGHRILEVLADVCENPSTFLDALTEHRVLFIGPGLDAILRSQPIITQEMWNNPAKPILDFIVPHGNFDSFHTSLVSQGWYRIIRASVCDTAELGDYMFFLTSGNCETIWIYQRTTFGVRHKLRVMDVEDVRARTPIAMFSRCCHRRLCTLFFSLSGGGVRPNEAVFDRLHRHYLHNAIDVNINQESIDVQVRKVGDSVAAEELIAEAWDTTGQGE